MQYVISDLGDFFEFVTSRLKEYYAACEAENVISAPVEKAIDEKLLPRINYLLDSDIDMGGIHDTKRLTNNGKQLIVEDKFVFASAEALDDEPEMIRALNLPSNPRSVEEITKEIVPFIDEVCEQPPYKIWAKYKASVKHYVGTKEMLDKLSEIVSFKDFGVISAVQNDETEFGGTVLALTGLTKEGNRVYNSIVAQWLSQNGYTTELSGNDIIVNGEKAYDVRVGMSLERESKRDYLTMQSVYVEIVWDTPNGYAVRDENMRSVEGMFNPELGEKMAQFITEEIFDKAVEEHKKALEKVGK